MRRRTPTGPPLHGLLVVDKPLGKTSMDVVRIVRRAAGGHKTGHAGTLDPLATGVLVVCLGQATKAVEGLMGLTKIYETVVDLSAFTATDDAEGPREEVAVARPPARAELDAVLPEFIGTIEQRPPQYSALKVDGRPAYRYARKGEAVELAARPVRIDSLEVLEFAWPRLALRVTCGRGTYIRSLARQLGERLGTGGHLASLRRTAIGPYTLERAVTLDALPMPLLQEQLLDVPEAGAS
ncbi:MAG: tRNA pseudouridine(55) synthase TruB [Planctomycetota bacterium]|nr:tRNA pseudouridine(55) synthase TruB [Planctomycetota bacterium]